MATPVVELADAILAGIQAKLGDTPTDWPAKSRWNGSPGLVLPKDPEAARVWHPVHDLEDIPENGQIWVVGMAADDQTTKSRTNTALREIPVQIAFQKLVDPNDKAAQDILVEAEDQLREICRLEVDETRFSWTRNESLKDDNGTPFSYTGLRQTSVWEAYFTAFYTYTLH